MRSSLLDDVSEVMRAVAHEVIMPRFRSLQDDEVEEKSPGELVTVADRESEQLLSEALLELLPGSRVVGEEQTSKQPSLIAGLEHDTVWLVDPLDGTRNFVEGRPCFAVMVALLQQGETVTAWLLDPLSDTMFRAERGAGAFVDDVRLQSPSRTPAATELRGAVLKQYMPDALREQVELRLPRIGASFEGMRCSGAEYPAIARGDQDFAVFWRTLPWDHAPGTLFVTEAGGQVARLDGSPYRVSDTGAGLLVARNAAIWRAAQTALFV